MTTGEPVTAGEPLAGGETAGRSAARPRWLGWLAGLLVLVAAAPFALNLAGDAQVHLAIAEAFADGRPFQFNPGGEIVVASTSPFWTMLLALFFRLAGAWTPALLSITAVVFWLSAGYALYRVARDLWRFRRLMLWGVVLLWLAHTTIVANALGGLENVASALQLLLLYWVVGKDDRPQITDHSLRTAGRRPPTADERPVTDDQRLPLRRAVLIGLLLGWALLTRPDGGLFALLLVALALPSLTGRHPTTEDDHPSASRPSAVGGQRSAESRGLWSADRSLLVRRLFLVGLVATLVLAPWFAYQVAETGRLLTDSSVARLYNGRMGSLMLIPDLLYLHPKPLLSLTTAFLPLAAGFLVFGARLGRAFVRARGGRVALYRGRLPQVTAVVLVVAGFLFYTVVVGAEAFGRYFLPLFPFFFLAGVAGLGGRGEERAEVGSLALQRGSEAEERAKALDYEPRSSFPLLPRSPAPLLFVLAAVLLLAIPSALDYTRRLGPGRFAPERALDVIRGPADRRYYAANVPFLIGAPARRAAATDEFLSDLGAAGADDVSVAVTEVQLRYFLDERVTVLSLDGRTSADILRYVDSRSGVPDFGRYFEDARPDFVHVRQWCEVGGWLASLFPSRIVDNLVCDWERRAATLTVGEAFDWDGRAVTLVAPDIVRIEWGEP